MHSKYTQQNEYIISYYRLENYSYKLGNLDRHKLYDVYKGENISGFPTISCDVGYVWKIRFYMAKSIFY
jgi:hypothetical protein